MPSHLDTGKQGEEIAVQYLRSHGYRILHRNIRCKRDEIDVIAYDLARAMIVFVEIKTRMRTSAAYPIHTAVDARKRRCLHRAVAYWITRNEYDGPGRIDLVCVCGNRIVEHIMDLGSDFF